MLKDNFKKIWIDALRVCATIAVIGVHVTAPILHQFGKITNFNWSVALFFNSIFRFCVPIFLMLTGILFLNKTFQLKAFLYKTFKRIIVPFIFWSLVYIFYNFLTNNLAVQIVSFKDMTHFIFDQLRNGASHHLWYIYLIIGIYLFIPLISKWIINSTKAELEYYLIIWFFVMLLDLPNLEKFKPIIDFTYFSGYLGYLILGYYLNNYCKSTIGLSRIFIFLGMGLTFGATYIFSYHKNSLSQGFLGYLSPFVLLSSIGVFLLFKNMKEPFKILIVPIKFISKYSYGIYLVHVLILDLLMKFGIFGNFINPLLGIPLTIVLCLLISSAIIVLLDRIPFGENISGKS